MVKQHYDLITFIWESPHRFYEVVSKMGGYQAVDKSKQIEEQQSYMHKRSICLENNPNQNKFKPQVRFDETGKFIRGK